MSGLRVERAGPLATLQDAGRFGVRRLGATQGGPADLHGWAWSNHLLGNPWNTPALEVVLGNLTMVVEQDAMLAIAGADLDAHLEGTPLQPGSAFLAKEGQRLTFQSPINGIRAYLAVAGGFVAEPVLGSVACVMRDGLGGHDGFGRSLDDGARLLFTDSCAVASGGKHEQPAAERIDYRQPVSLAMVPGAQIADFTGVSLYRAFNNEWRVDDRADRMGVRLAGDVLRCQVASMISEGIALGAVQVPPDGQPIVLLNDRQTIGGYPRLGTLTPLACSRLAQCQPGQTVRLRATALSQAQQSYRAFRQQFSV
ncbi:5-oxoprolinase subunit C family protein [Aidingimonas lacisalsi]|uniref:5-oxoprolinase subunit C family protein n=1 Tax=Aidingimonas lacisalsi TaxID=2604086 RepID=UPI0011D254AB|nr:biotin-dependent carboxyltransferase family protein [Aidingimonas lacisalsi]